MISKAVQCTKASHILHLCLKVRGIYPPVTRTSLRRMMMPTRNNYRWRLSLDTSTQRKNENIIDNILLQEERDNNCD